MDKILTHRIIDTAGEFLEDRFEEKGTPRADHIYPTRTWACSLPPYIRQRYHHSQQSHHVGTAKLREK